MPSSVPSTIRVLLVDDDEEDHFIIRRLFAAMTSIKWELEWVATSDEGIEAINERRHDVYLLDYRLDARTGLDVLQKVDARERDEPFILLTGVGDRGLERESLSLAAADFLVKRQLTSDSLSRALYYALGRKAQEKKKIDQLKEVNRTKDEFISIASHQLRTPVTTVKQYLAMVIDGLGGESISGRQMIFLQKAYESNERQLTIINNLLKVAQIDSGTMELARQYASVSQLVRDAMEDFCPMFSRSGQRIEGSIEGDIFATIDENAIRMVIDNLFENAKKYSEPDNTTRVSVGCEDDSVTVTISDEGVGVTHPERLFKKFSRIENKLSAQVNGTGLGLYWAQSIARMHGGDLTYAPSHSGGSEFTLKLPRVK